KNENKNENKNNHIRVCRYMMRILLIKSVDKNHLPYTYQSFPFRLALRSNWKLWLSELSDDSYRAFLSRIAVMMHGGSDDKSLQARVLETGGLSNQVWDYKPGFAFTLFDLEEGLRLLFDQYEKQLKGVEAGGRVVAGEGAEAGGGVVAGEGAREKIGVGFEAGAREASCDALAELLSTLSLIALTFALWVNPKGYESDLMHLGKLMFPEEITGKLFLTEGSQDLAYDEAYNEAYNEEYSKAYEEVSDKAYCKAKEECKDGAGASGDKNALRDRNGFKRRTLCDVGKDDNRLAYEELNLARALIERADYDAAGKGLERIIREYLFSSDEVLGQALFLLGNCCQYGYKVPEMYSSVEDIFRQARLLGCEKTPSRIEDILEVPQPADEEDGGICVLNVSADEAEEGAAGWFLKTVPPNWTVQFSESSLRLLDDISNRNSRLVFISPDFSRNVMQTLQVIDGIKKRVTAGETSLEDWADLEIYIRCEEEVVCPLLDTALSFIVDLSKEDGRPSGILRIYLIDDHKRAAQLLLARHCLHYPLTMPGYAGDRRARTQGLRFVIVSNQEDDRYVSWLVREAFWMMPVTRDGIEAKIIVLSPNASATGARISAKCPGLAKFSRYNGIEWASTDCEWKSRGSAGNSAASPKSFEYRDVVIDDISFPQIEYVDTDFSTDALVNEIRRQEKSRAALYYAVDASSDLESVALATQIREISIRCAIEGRKIRSYSRIRPTIAFRCLDPDYARLAQELLVPKEDEVANNQWYNSYGLVSWGTVKELYSWENLSGGAIERLSECMHLQYSGAAPEDGTSNGVMASYFNRLYNRDSSFAGAMSFPVRLFTVNIVPEAWFIQDGEAYWGKAQREYLPEQFVRKYTVIKDVKRLLDENTRETLAKYEHARWCLYMLSRGYLPANADVQMNETVDYMKAGAPRHVLQIAKLHPCICSWEQMKLLQRRLDNEYNLFYSGGNESSVTLHDDRFAKYADPDRKFDYFTSIDYSNIESMPELLRLEWFALERDAAGRKTADREESDREESGRAISEKEGFSQEASAREASGGKTAVRQDTNRESLDRARSCNTLSANGI
ncbi:MAG: hypothetical protein LUF30_04970, partial [Lachnospiraceae bacterium]|nr:hypothetical protein [Lachnospiraceae bacterium]